jgi:hypothetical protein
MRRLLLSTAAVALAVLAALAAPVGASPPRAVAPTPDARAWYVVNGATGLPYGRPAVPLVARRPLVKLVRSDHPLVRKVVAASTVSLPVRREQRLGRIEVWQDGTLLGTRPLVAAQAVPRPVVGRRLRWYATRTVHDLSGLLP